MKRKIALFSAAVFAAVSLSGCINPNIPIPDVTYTQEDIDNSARWLTIEDNVVTDCSDEATKVVIPDTVTGIGEKAFMDCKNLKAVKIPESVTEIYPHAFGGCTGLTSINIPNSVTKIHRQAFEGCTGLTSIIIPDSVTEICNWAFCDCTGLTSVNIPDSVTDIGLHAFYGCTKISATYKGKTYDYDHINDLYKAARG